jgi:hypothetical protein
LTKRHGANKGQRAVRTYNAVLNILTDLALVAVPTMIVLPFHITSGRRATLIAGFWTRLMYVVSSILEPTPSFTDSYTTASCSPPLFRSATYSPFLLCMTSIPYGAS